MFEVPPDFVTAQLDAVFDDLTVDAVKIGMVSRRETIEAIVRGLRRWRGANIVLDPVMIATSGDRLLSSSALDALLGTLIPLARIVTPNLPEAAALLDEPLAGTESGITKQGERLLRLGCPAVLIKGGHGEGPDSIDYLFSEEGIVRLAAPRIATANTHGTGCSLSSAIAAGLAKGESLNDAVSHAKDFISAAIAAADRLGIGQGHGPVHHFHAFNP